MTRYDFLLLSKYVQIYIIFHLELLFWRRKQIWDNFWSSCLFASVKIYPHIEYNFLQKLWENYTIAKLIKWTTMYFTITTTLKAKCKTLHCAMQSKLIFYKIWWPNHTSIAKLKNSSIYGPLINTNEMHFLRFVKRV